MSRLRHLELDGRVVPLALSGLSFVLAFWQRPFRTFTDTRIELASDPSLFLSRVAHVWSPTTDLGHIQSSQFVGYLFPMGPYFALAQSLGIPIWIAQRIWLGFLLAFAAWGVVALMDRIYCGRRGIAHLTAGLLFAANPYVAVILSRGTVWLLAYAMLPWLLLAAHRGLEEPLAWRWPAAIGVLLASGGGGVNAALVFWVALGPVALVSYELVVMGRARRDAFRFIRRSVLCVVVASAWWILPVLVQSRYGVDFLTFTEHPESILATTSASESLRLLGYWVTYFGYGFGGGSQSVLPAIGSYIFTPAVILGSLLVPLIALGGLRWTWKWPYAPFFAMLAAAAVLVMSAGFPEGTALHRLLVDAYYHVGPLEFLRTAYKAVPLLALALACLAGASVDLLVTRAREPGLRALATRIPAWTLLGLVAVAVLWAKPLWRGNAIDPQLAFGTVPAAWRDAVGGAQRRTPSDQRIAILPGETFGWYRWGGTWDSVAPGLSRRPVLVRQLARDSDVSSSELLVAVDDLVQQGRLVPGQLTPLLKLMGVGEVLVATDTKGLRSGALDPARAAEIIGGQPGFEHPVANYGPLKTLVPTIGRGGPVRRLPEVRAYALPGQPGPGIIRSHPAAAPMIVDGDADGLTALSAVGSLDPSRALFYAGNLDPHRLREELAAGAALVFTDSNRRRVRLPSATTTNLGPTLGPQDPISQQWPRYDPFPATGSAGQTVAVYSGLRYLRTPSTPGFSLFPQYRPYAAFDGSLTTPWLANAADPGGRYIELALAQPQSVESLTIHPHEDASGRTSALWVSVNGRPERRVDMRPGWNRVHLGAHPLRTLRLRIAAVTAGLAFPALGGIDEIRIPGLSVSETLRLPTDLAAATRKLDLASNPVEIILQRTTADFPFRTGDRSAQPQAESSLDMTDAEPGIVRQVELPTSRKFSLDGWASVAPLAPGPALDRIEGLPPGWRFNSSPRFEGIAGSRASSAFDGDTSTAWIGDLRAVQVPWLSWRAPRPVTVDRLQLVPSAGPYKFPTQLRVYTVLGPIAVAVGRDGFARLPHPIRTSGMRIDITGLRRPLRGLDRLRQLQAVAIAEIRIPGLHPPALHRSGPFHTACGALTVSTGARVARARVVGRLEDLDAGRPSRLTGCGPSGQLALPAGATTLAAPAGEVYRPDYLRLASPAISPGHPSVQPAPSVHVTQSGVDGSGHAELRLATPSWLVVGQSYSRGWRAWCSDGSGHERSLGAPTPIDGYANGWQVGPQCRRARFAFGPQTAANAAYALSGFGAAALLGILAIAAWRTRRGRGRVRRVLSPIAPRFRAPDPALRRWTWIRALGVAAIVGLIAGEAFSWRTGALLAVGSVLLGREGLGARRLYGIAGIAIAIIPVQYLTTPASTVAGFDFDFARQHLGSHSLAIIATVCVLTGGLLDAAALRRAVGRAGAAGSRDQPRT